jgi:hypothetical protein
MDKDKILSIVMSYVNKHKEFWGCEEYVHQNDDAQFEAVEMFADIISALPAQETEEE